MGMRAITKKKKHGQLTHLYSKQGAPPLLGRDKKIYPVGHPSRNKIYQVPLHPQTAPVKNSCRYHNIFPF